jgi:anti-sigma factor RsiW
MDCSDVALQLDDLLDGRLDAPSRKAFEDHLARCAECRGRHEHAAVVQDAVRKLVPPAMHPGFVDRALSRATRPAAPKARWRPVLGMALAASLVLGVALGVFFATRPAVQTVALILEQPQTVRLMFNSARPLKAATLSIALPDNVDLVGYGGQRELSWQTDLREGGNLMQLPLVVHAAPKEDLVARLSHEDSTKTFRLKIQVANAGRGL